MKMPQKLSNKWFLLLLICLTSYNNLFSQSKAYPLSFEANQGSYKNTYGEYFYKIKQEGNKYRLTNEKGQDIFDETFDTIVKNQHFIKISKEDVIAIYRIKNLEKVAIPNLKKVYFKQNGLEVLTSNGAQYYDNSISKIDHFPTLEFFKCGTVYSEKFTLTYNEKTKTHSIELSEGSFGGLRDEIFLKLKDLPNHTEAISFLNGAKYLYKSINNDYNVYPNYLKIVANGISSIYSYNIDKAQYPVKKKSNRTGSYSINKVTSDTIWQPIPPIELISSRKKGNIKVQQVTPIKYDSIQQSAISGLVYLYKDKKTSVFPGHISPDFDFFRKKTTSFYAISKNGKVGWIDIRTFKEYYF